MGGFLLPWETGGGAAKWRQTPKSAGRSPKDGGVPAAWPGAFLPFASCIGYAGADAAGSDAYRATRVRIVCVDCWDAAMRFVWRGNRDDPSAKKKGLALDEFQSQSLAEMLLSV